MYQQKNYYESNRVILELHAKLRKHPSQRLENIL